ncbi:RNA polymerase sigma factor [Polyangium spumosum]|uniref:RNA polymerase sigma factor n=1 Tax=Polyangium spumosum TaxID=889282 RepID=UPI0030843CF1
MQAEALAFRPLAPPALDPMAALLLAVGLGRRAPRAPRPKPAPVEAVRQRPSPGIVASVAVARTDLEAERELCERARAGDRAALGQILRRYGPILYRSVLLPRLGREALAQDALAETYARVVERFHQFQWQDAGVYPWLRVVGMRIAYDILRSRKRETLYEPDDLQREIDAAEADPQANGEAELCEKRDLAEARARVEAALRSIHPRYAEAIRLRVLEERSREEVASALGVTVSTFDVVLHRALAALKKAIDVPRAGEGKLASREAPR